MSIEVGQYYETRGREVRVLITEELTRATPVAEHTIYAGVAIRTGSARNYSDRRPQEETGLWSEDGLLLNPRDFTPIRDSSADLVLRRRIWVVLFDSSQTDKATHLVRSFRTKTKRDADVERYLRDGRRILAEWVYEEGKS